MGVLHVVAADWAWRRDVLMALGVDREHADRIDALIGPAPTLLRRPPGPARRAEVVAFVELAGGDM